MATELDSFDGRKDPERCTSLVNQLRMCQDKVRCLCMILSKLSAGSPHHRENRENDKKKNLEMLPKHREFCLLKL